MQRTQTRNTADILLRSLFTSNMLAFSEAIQSAGHAHLDGVRHPADNAPVPGVTTCAPFGTTASLTAHTHDMATCLPISYASSFLFQT